MIRQYFTNKFKIISWDSPNDQKCKFKHICFMIIIETFNWVNHDILLSSIVFWSQTFGKHLYSQIAYSTRSSSFVWSSSINHYPLSSCFLELTHSNINFIYDALIIRLFNICEHNRKTSLFHVTTYIPTKTLVGL